MFDSTGRGTSPLAVDGPARPQGRVSPPALISSRDLDWRDEPRSPDRARIRAGLAGGGAHGGARRAAARWCCWPARPVWARRASPRRWSQSADARFLRGTCGPEAAAYGPVTAALRGFMRAVPGGLSELRSAALASGPAAARARRARPRRATAPRCSRRSAAGWPRWRPSGRRWCSSTTSSGPTTPRSSCSPRSPLPCASCRCSCSAPTARTRSRARTSSGGCATTCAATMRWRELTLEPLTAQGTAALAETVLGAAPVRRGSRDAARPHRRDPVLRRGARRGARGRRAAATGRREGLELALDARRAAAADDSRRRAAAGGRPVRSGARDRGGGFGGRHPLRRRARGRARPGGWSRRAARRAA